MPAFGVSRKSRAAKRPPVPVSWHAIPGLGLPSLKQLLSIIIHIMESSHQGMHAYRFSRCLSIIFDLERSVIPSRYADLLSRTQWKSQAPAQPCPSTDLGQHLQAFASSERASFQRYFEIASSRNHMLNQYHCLIFTDG